MKKIIVCGIAAALVAGCSDKPKTEEVKVFDVACEKVAAFEQGDMIVKCPVTEGLTAIQAQEANAKFEAGTLFEGELKATAETITNTCLTRLALEKAGITEETQTAASQIISSFKNLTSSN